MNKKIKDKEYNHSINIGGGLLEMELRTNSMTIKYCKSVNGAKGFYETSGSGEVWDWSDPNYTCLVGTAFDKYLTKKMKDYLIDWFGTEFILNADELICLGGEAT